MLKSQIYRLFLIIGLGLSYIHAHAQDPQYSQYYAAPLYLNPAFTGSEFLPRVGVNYRNQWPGLNAQFTTFSAYFDTFLDDYNSGVGFLVMSDTEGAARLRSTTLAALYSYELQLGERAFFRPGFRASYIRREIGFFENLIFANNINPSEPFGDLIPGTDIPGLGDPVNMLSLSAGGLFYTPNFWLGFSADHLNQPNQSFLDGVSRLPAKYSLHAGYRISLGTGGYRSDFTHTFKERYIVPTVNYKRQGPFEQLDVGAYLYAEPIVLGLWYRGLPYRPIENQSNRDAIVMMVGVNLPSGLNVGYSFDYTVSQLGIQSGGAHEISISVLLADRNRNKLRSRDTMLPCPKF
ncbi:PorP/SprF family type IX secretion system membrane protein [Mongoliitalea daihaiensis]|uniref:PorP/SprF family type IX secretion system membrane protein n=1 Tax=Mongoliitalea daihaiensis TaxID=2782006 RepID=UPI001F33F533|nr:type IX secretion system membrane protein PorP/SprF [Mongoliitalea daihaiensis]UJP65450.1 type IX secretion system membrane protein PorP/SprF [Mongoliitalea daihaiensis]